MWAIIRKTLVFVSNPLRLEGDGDYRSVLVAWLAVSNPLRLEGDQKMLCVGAVTVLGF